MKRWLGVLLCFLTSAAQAALQVEPQVARLDLDGGAEQTVSFEVYNEGGPAAQIKIEPEFWYGGDTLAATAALVIMPENFHLAAGQRSKVRVRYTMPRDQDGETLLMVFFAREETQPLPGENFRIRSRVGIPVYLRRKGSNRTQGRITELSFKNSGKDRNFVFALNVQNVGNVHFQPFGVLQIKDVNGKSCRDLDVRFERTVFPGQSGHLEIQVNNLDLSAGRYIAEVRLFLGQSALGAAQDLFVVTDRIEINVLAPVI